MRIVGTNHGGYANLRNISALPMQRYRVVRTRNLFRAPNYAYFRLKGKMHPYFPFLHWSVGPANCDLLHFFNGISLGNRPWLSTFETFMPRWGAYGGERIEWGLKKLAKPSCKRLIALCKCTQEIQRQFLEKYPSYSEEIQHKVCVLHPPQAALVEEAALTTKVVSRSKTGTIRMVLVGADFFRKGGLEVLNALDVLLQSKASLQLDIVSTMNFGDYASKSSKSDLEAAMQTIAKYPANITLHRQMSNAEVLEIFRMADIGLLPTWADTYGYAALEAMAAGCPVISTDVRALPEINAIDRGWLIPTLKDSWGNAILDTETQRKKFSLNLTEALIGIFQEIETNPERITTKSQNALAYIQQHHSPELTAKTLETWYDDALSVP